MSSLRDVIVAKYSEYEWAWSGDADSYSSLVWHDETPCPTEEELENLKNIVDVEKQNNEYKNLRASAYPSIQDQLDLLFHGGLDSWKTKIQEIKDQYPKPEGIDNAD